MKSQQQQRSKVLCRLGATCLIAAVGTLLVLGCDDRRDQAILPPAQTSQQAQPAMPQPTQQRRVDFTPPTTQWVQAQTNQPGTMALRILNTNPQLIVQGFMIPRDANIAELVNKWEEVLGLPKSDASTIQSSIIKTRVTHGGASAFTADLASPASATEKKRLLAAIVPDDQTQQNVTFILLGPAESVESERANFDQFVDSVKFQTVSTAPQGPLPAQPFRLRFATPPNWKQEQTSGANGIDLVLHAPDGAAIVISRQTLQTGQQFIDNPNSLRAAAGLSPLPQGQKQNAYQVAIGSQQGLMFDLTSNPGETPAKRTLFSIVPQGGILVCIQLFGTTEQIEQHRQEYGMFLQSLTFIPMNPDGTEAAPAGGAMPNPGALGPPSPVTPTTAPSQMMSPQTQPSTAPAFSPPASPLRLN